MERCQSRALPRRHMQKARAGRTRPPSWRARTARTFPSRAACCRSELRSHLLALYGYARLTDELGDELDGDRLGALDWLEAELDRAFAGTATHPLMVRLGRDDRELPLAARAVRAAHRREPR